MSTTAVFIERIAQKLGRPTPITPPTKIEVSLPKYSLESEKDTVEIFIKAWEALGGKTEVAKSSEEIEAALKKWFGEQPEWLNHHSIVAWQDLSSEALKALNNLHWPIRVYSDLPRDKSDRTAAVAQAYLGVTGADWGLARSGSLVLKSGKGRGRAVSLVPPRHLSFIRASTIFPDLMGLFEELDRQGTPPAAIEIISGPSRTSDIEMDLSIGVHGPIEVFTIVIQD